MTQYEWLHDLRNRIERAKFLVFEPISPMALEAFESGIGPLPDAYREFLLTFGEARLFRSFISDSYELTVEAPSHIDTQEVSSQIVRVGRSGTETALYVWQNGSLHGKGSLYGIYQGHMREIASSFEQWLEQGRHRARSQYSRKEWAQVLAPVLPFTEEEQRVVDALAQFRFHQVGLSDQGGLVVEVKNDSPIQLPWIPVKMKWLWGDGSLGTGAGIIPTSKLKPGEARLTEVSNTYKDAGVKPEQIELIAHPPILPDDRPFYQDWLNILWGKARKGRLTKRSPVSSNRHPKNLHSRGSRYPLYGEWKYIDEIELADLRAHPVWLWCVALGLEDEQDGPIGGDETSLRPLLSAPCVTSDMVQPLILLRISGTHCFASGLYDHTERRLEAVRIFGSCEFTRSKPLTLVAVPTIESQSHVEFLLESAGSRQANRA